MKQYQLILKKTHKGIDYTFKIGFDIEFAKKTNQEPYFSITGEGYTHGKARIDCNMEFCGAIGDRLKDVFPEYAHLNKYHLASIKEPNNYIANSLYHASDRDHNGLLKGEKRQIKNGRTGLLAWHLMAIDKVTGEEKEIYEIEKSFDGENPPDCKYTLEYRPWCVIGTGKEPDLKAARASAIWPDAELSDFTEEKLKARLPALMAQFRKDVENAGITWPDHTD